MLEKRAPAHLFESVNCYFLLFCQTRNLNCSVSEVFQQFKLQSPQKIACTLDTILTDGCCVFFSTTDKLTEDLLMHPHRVQDRILDLVAAHELTEPFVAVEFLEVRVGLGSARLLA